MLCLRALCILFCIFVSATLCASGTRPSGRGVEGSFEASCDPVVNPVKPLVILDAGHGGNDEGAKVNAFMEKKLTLATALMVKKHLEKMDYRVLMTRGHDVYLPVQRRVAIANKMKGALFVSVHFNSAPSAEAKGVEIFYFDSREQWRSRASKRLANCILYRIVDQTEAVSRGVKQGNFHVIRETDMPAVLVEGGFMTNKEERGNLRDRVYLDRLAVGIAQGIDRYMKM